MGVSFGVREHATNAGEPDFGHALRQAREGEFDPYRSKGVDSGRVRLDAVAAVDPYLGKV